MKNDTGVFSTKEKILLPLLFMFAMFLFAYLVSNSDKDTEIRRAYFQTMNNNCSNNENSYSCYNTKFNKPVVASHRNRYFIKEQAKRRDLLKYYKTTFDDCLNNYKNTTNINLNKCHNSLTLFQDDLNDKTLEIKLSQYQKENIKSSLEYFRKQHFQVHVKRGRR